jgi:HSP20 family molecular chaperone IbpA
VNLGEVTARMANGILVIRIPKVVERRGRERRIPVTTG